MTLTEEYGTRLKRIKPKGKMDIPAKDCTVASVRAYYRAAQRYGMKVSIKNTPDGMRLWRLA